jgi:hypothetical protein
MQQNKKSGKDIFFTILILIITAMIVIGFIQGYATIGH